MPCNLQIIMGSRVSASPIARKPDWASPVERVRAHGHSREEEIVSAWRVARPCAFQPGQLVIEGCDESVRIIGEVVLAPSLSQKTITALHTSRACKEEQRHC
jgi:hypothetical protein